VALNARFKITMLDVFPHGAYLVSEVEAVRNFDKSTAGRPVQAVDKTAATTKNVPIPSRDLRRRSGGARFRW
jgi:hypothetical protein